MPSRKAPTCLSSPFAGFKLWAEVLQGPKRKSSNKDSIAIVYVGLAVASLGIFGAAKWGASTFAAALMALLLLSIHAEWDLVTFLAPRASPPDPSASKKKR